MIAVRILTAALLTGVLAIAQTPQGTERLGLPWVFTDHMVLQRGPAAPIFGTAAPGARVVVTFGEATNAADADATGAWRVDLPALEATSVGRDLVVTTGNDEVRLRDVVVGEVWLCAGQSNMDFPLQRAVGGKEAATALPAANLLRLCNRTGSPGGGSRRLNDQDLANIASGNYYRGGWQLASPTSAPAFSAVGFFFGLQLTKALDVPVGLIDVSIGGSTTEGWISRAMLAADPALAPLTEDYLATHLSHPFIRERTLTHLAAWVEAGRPEPRPRHMFEPGFLFEQAIETLAPFGIAGVVWYQGESNAHLPRTADRLFRLMVAEWRRRWLRPELPLYFVQLPAMGRASWPEFREVQASWLDLPHTGMAVTIDTGHPTNVHPRDKRPVGERLARLALADSYGHDVAMQGPTPGPVRRTGHRLEITFENAAGLAWAEGQGPTGFEVSGKDRRFYPARAELDGSRIVLSSPEVAAPVDARYAWAPVPAWSLVNGSGLPAAPFRTHAWRPVRIACIGDSITAGKGLPQPATDSYPARLQQRLGDGFRVENFGHSGTGVVLSTMRGKWARAFRRNPEHQDALCFQPDIVVSNLGINDIMAWAQTKKVFAADYLALIDDYRALPGEPEILLWSPLAPLFPGQRFHGSPHEREIHQAIARVARKARCAKIDLDAPLREHPEWFPDHIHPNARGAAVIADTVFASLVEHRLVTAPDRRVRLYVITGQSNSLGTTADLDESDPTPGKHAADAHIRLFWSNRSTRAGDGPAVLLGDSKGVFATLQAQQGEGRNKTFWGPEVGFGRALYEAGERDFVLVKASRGGGGNGFWSKGAADDHMYRHVVDTVAAAVAALPPATKIEVAALLYLQGESDNAAEAKVAGRRLEALARNLRRELPQAKRMRVLVGGIAAAGDRRDRVREQQRAAAERDPKMVYFSNIDLQGQLYDKLHFDHKAKLEIGRRFAAAWQSLGGPRALVTTKR